MSPERSDAAIQPHLVVDRFARGLELLLVFVLRGGEQLADDAIVQVDDFVGDGGHPFDDKRHERRVAPLRLELGQVSRRHLRTLAGNLQQAILVDQTLGAGRQFDRLQRFQALDVLQHVARVRLDRRLAQRGQPGQLAAAPALEQRVQVPKVGVRQRLGQCAVDAAVRSRHRLGADALDHVERRRDDMAAAQHVERVAGQHHTLVGLQRQLGERVNRLAEVAEAKRRQAEVGTQLDQMLAPRLLTLGVLRPTHRVDAQLARDPVQQRHRHGAINGQALAGIAKQAHLYREAQPVCVAAALPDQRQVVVVEGVVLDQFVLGVWQGQQAVALGGR